MEKEQFIEKWLGNPEINVCNEESKKEMLTDLTAVAEKHVDKFEEKLHDLEFRIMWLREVIISQRERTPSPYSTKTSKTGPGSGRRS